MIAAPALGGIILAALVITGIPIDGWRQCAVVALLASPAVWALARYIRRHSDDPWIRGIALPAIGTAILTAIGWAVGWLGAVGTVATWLFFHDDTFMHRSEATIIVASVIVPAAVTVWRWLGRVSWP